MGKTFHGYIDRDTVVIEDSGESSTIFNRSETGYFVKGRLRLSMVEAFYLMNENKLELDVTKKEFLKRALSAPDFQTRYMVYRELRKRGFLIRDDDFMYIRRGGEQKEKGEMRVLSFDEKNVFDFSEIYDMADDSDLFRRYHADASKEQQDGRIRENSKNPRKKNASGTFDESIGGEDISEIPAKKRSPLIFAIVDGDGDVTYYSIKRHFPKGPHNADITGRYGALLMDDMGIMLEDYDELHSLFYGKKMGDALYLSTLECIYLIKKGALSLTEDGREVSPEELMERSREKDPEMDSKLTIYSDLMDRGLIVRTGFKYGTHFRVYVRDVEQHAKYLAHAVSKDYKGTWPEISRGVRLAHGVKKEFILAEASKEPRYLRIKRVRL